MRTVTLTDRQAELIELALDACTQAFVDAQRGGSPLDPLAAEYQAALNAMRAAS